MPFHEDQSDNRPQATSRRLLTIVLSMACAVELVLLGLCSYSAAGVDAVCQVPSPTYPTVQSAIDDGECTTVSVAEGRYSESVEILRTVDVVGVSSLSTEIAGIVSVAGPDIDVHLQGLRIQFDGVGGGPIPNQVLAVSGGAAVTTSDVVVVRRVWPEGFIFYDGFETGTTDQWSVTIPGSK